MKRIIAASLTLSGSAFAHHTADHTMLQQEPAHVIAETRPGEAGDWMHLLWVPVALVLLLGLIGAFKRP